MTSKSKSKSGSPSPSPDEPNVPEAPPAADPEAEVAAKIEAVEEATEFDPAANGGAPSHGPDRDVGDLTDDVLMVDGTIPIDPALSGVPVAV